MSPFRRFSFWAAIIASFVLTILASLIIAEIYQDPLASINPTEFSDTPELYEIAKQIQQIESDSYQLDGILARLCDYDDDERILELLLPILKKRSSKIEFYFNKTKAYAGVCSSGVKNFISTFDPDCLDHYVGALEKFCREPKIVDAMNMEMKRCLDKNDFENI